MADGELRQRGPNAPKTVREPMNSFETKLLSPNERILSEVFNIYNNKENGLSSLGQLLGTDIRVPRRKITVLLIGNHSAGKSSFINWYIEEHILKTGVAIETQGFAFVTSGKKRDTLKGQATLQLYPYLRPLQDMPGVLDFLTTEICTSRAKKFNMVTFIDTPGLVDGDLHYPFDVNETILWLGEMADLVFVFFDPMGQALCKRTLGIVEKLWANHSEKIRLYLAKADEAGTETDRQRVLMQIVQELCKRPGLNRSGFDMPTIFLPDIATKPTRCANQITDVCAEVEKVIEQTVQNSLNNLETDCEIFATRVDMLLRADKEARDRNWKRSMRTLFFACLGMFIPILLFLSLIVANSTEAQMRKHLGFATDVFRYLLNPIAMIWTLLPEVYRLQLIVLIVLVSGSCLIVPRLHPKEEVLSRWDLKAFRKASVTLENAIKKKKELYSDYLKQSVTDADYCD